MMPISELPLGIFSTDQVDQILPPPGPGGKLERMASGGDQALPRHAGNHGKASATARKLSGIMMDKWAHAQGKLFFFVAPCFVATEMTRNCK